MANFDRAERQILEFLQRRGRIANVELAEKVGLSESPCLRRVRALEDDGTIQGYGARLNQRALGLQVTAFVQVSLEKADDRLTREFLERVKAEEHIIECHAMSGGYDYLLKLVSNNMDHFSELTLRGILRFPGVKDIESSFSLGTIKENSPLPIGGGTD